jgi:hypothetical protein
MPSLSASKYQTLQSCRRLFYWEYVRFVERLRQPGARAFGTLYHLGLEAWWKEAGEGDVPWKSIDEALVAALKAIDGGANHIDTDKYEHAKARAMMIGYHAVHMNLEFQLLGKTGTEEWFSAPLRDPDGRAVEGWTIQGRKDVIAKLATRARSSVVEHKSTTSDITPGSDYWIKAGMDGQASIYLEAASASDLGVGDVLWDASRKPDISPERETPEDRREMTKGKGCKKCGGSAGGKNGIKKGEGMIEIKKGQKNFPAEAAGAESVIVQCPDCKGSGWKPGDEPRFKANVNLQDEPVEEYQQRIAEAIADNPLAYFHMGTITRSEEQLAEMRANLVAAALEIDYLFERARRDTNGNLSTYRARLVFQQNTEKCLNIYGRRCDFIDVCSGSVREPTESQLYRIKQRPGTPR